MATLLNFVIKSDKCNIQRTCINNVFHKNKTNNILIIVAGLRDRWDLYKGNVDFMSSFVSCYFEIVITQLTRFQKNKILVNYSVLLLYSSVDQVKIEDECLSSYHQERRKIM
jgi:hypothetical protein